LSNLTDIARRRVAHVIASCLALGGVAAVAPTALAQEPAQEQAASTVRVPERTLRSGDSGGQVKVLQRALTAAGFRVKADGQFGAGTKRAVRAFQATVGLNQSGVAGRRTRAKLQEALAGTVARTANSGGFNRSTPDHKRRLGDRVPVRQGMSGRDVKMLQDFLRRAGFRVSVDGEFGRGTTRAVRAFERQQRRTVDGLVDAGDIAALRGRVGADLIAAPETDTPPPTPQLAPGDRAQIGSDGLAIAPANAPEQVKRIIAAGNQIAKHPYLYGGGHKGWQMDRGFDCSGSVSWALRGVPQLIASPLPSYGFYTWGEAGPGKWVTIYTKDSHMYMVVAGIRFDTSGRSRAGTRWQADDRSPAGFQVRHPAGL
jgi:peptidoglycan hydrolase-like protein with peptidoglycan-binding domain